MRKESKLVKSMMAIALLAVSGAYAVDVNANFSTGEGTNGWTISANSYASPDYTNAVDQISLSYAGQGASGSTIVYAADAQGGEDRQVATISAASSSATFAFPDTTSFRVFRIETTGDMALQSFFAKVSEATLESPSGVIISNNITGTSFDAYWNAVEGATGYRVYVWTNAVVGVSEGTALWQETFANSPAKSNSTAFNVSYTDSGESAWTFDKVYAHSEAGMVRIGNTSAKGVLVSPALGDVVTVGDPLTLRVRVCKQESKDGDFMPIGIVSDDITNILEVLEITTTPTEYQIDLPTLSATDRLAFLSPTNKSSARAILDDVAIVSGYSEGHEEPAYIVNGLDVGNVTSCALTDLPPVPVSFAVVASGRRGTVSGQSDAVMVDLTNPDKVVSLIACQMSSLVGNVYSQDFDSLAYVTSTTSGSEWKNGTTLPFWQAFQNDSAVDMVSLYKGGNATGVKFLVLATNENDAVRALGARVNKDTTMTWGLAFTNDTGAAMSLTHVSYSAQQWGFANTNSHALVFSSLVTNRLDWITSWTDGWTNRYETIAQCLKDVQHDMPVVTSVEFMPVDGIRIAPGEVLYLKWTFHPPAKGNSALMAIDDLTVRFDVSQQRGLVIRLVKHQSQAYVP